MGQRAETLAFGKTQIAAGASIFASTLLWACLFALTGIAANDLFTFELQIVTGKLLSMNFAFFLLAFPLTVALTAGFAKKMEKAGLTIVAMTANVAALIIAMLAFPALQSLWIPAVFYIISIPLAVETAFVKYSELKTWVTMRTVLSAAGKATTMVSIGLIALSISTIGPQQQQYIEKFEDFVLDFAYGLGSGKPQQALTSSAADAMVERDIGVAKSLVQSPAFSKLKEKTDPDVMLFVLQAEGFADKVESPEYKQQVEQQLGQASSSVIQEADILGIIKRQFPFFETIESLLWVLHTITIVGIFTILANVVCKPMAVLYGVIADKLLSLF